MKKLILLIFLIGMCLLNFSQTFAQDPSTTYTPYFPNYPPLSVQEMMAFAREGAEFLKNGGDLKEFSKNPGRFTKGVFLDYRYLAVADCQTKTLLAHPFMPKILDIPGLMFKTRDVRGRAYNAELCEAVQRNPNGAWNVSFIKKPGEETVDLLYQYNIKVKTSNLVVGVFSRNLKINNLLEKRASEEEEFLNSLVDGKLK